MNPLPEKTPYTKPKFRRLGTLTELSKMGIRATPETMHSHTHCRS
jgi:hypothetical protein